MVHIRRFAGFVFVLVLLIQLADSQGQIRLDGSLGPQGDLTGPDYTIPVEVGQQRGGHLFHSFDRFHVGTGESATFAGPDQVNNAIGRITGGHASTIDGVLQSAIPDANLFLLNPQGVVFGPNARLDVDGSFHTSTADALRFEDGATFFADLGKQSALTIASPAAFGFLQAQPAPITVQGSKLHVPEGETLSLIGGAIDITGGADDFFAEPILDAPGGRIHLVSAGSPGDVVIDVSGSSSLLQVETIERFDTITISDFALLSVSGDRGGTLVIRGRNLVVDSSNIFADTLGDNDGAAMGIDIEVTETFVHTHGGFITTDSVGAGQAGDIRITADVVQVEEEAFIGSGAFADGNAGNIAVEATTVMLIGGAVIESTTLDLGEGGTVTVRASETVLLAGTTPDSFLASAINAETLGMGHAGEVLVEAKTVTLTGGAAISSTTFGPGRGGAVTVRASDAVTLTGTSQDTSLPSSISANSLGLEDAEIGDGGSVLVQARTVEITGGVQIGSETISTGRGGTVTIRVAEAVIVDGADEIGLPSAIATSTFGMGERAGDGGSILIEARSVMMTGGAEIGSSTAGSGQGGTTTVQATDTVTVAGADTGVLDGIPSGIHADTLGVEVNAGNGGAIRVEARSVQITEGAEISSRTRGPGRGGTVTIMATDTIAIKSQNSRITTNADGSGAGGDISASARDIGLRQGATISSASSDTGDAGSVTITTDTLRLRDGSMITTRAETADGGEIRLTVGTQTQLRDSQVTAEVGSGSGGGGNISADSEFVVLQNSQLRANAFGGPGGRIIVQAEVFLADPDSLITASSELNVDGIVDIRAPVTELSNTVTPLSKRFASVASLLSQQCVARRQEETDSSFFLTGRDRVPLHPGGALPSPLTFMPRPQPAPRQTAVAPMLSYDLDASIRRHRNPCPR